MSIKVILYFLILFSVAGKCLAQQPELLLPAGHILAISDVRFSPDGKLAVTTSMEQSVKIWESQSGKLLHTLNGHSDMITSVNFSPDGKYILTTGHDQHARIWESATGHLFYDIYFSFSNWITAGFFSNNGKELLLISDYGMELYDINNKKLIRGIFDSALLRKESVKYAGSAIMNGKFSDDGKYIITTQRDSSLKIWETKSGSIIHKFKNEKGLFNYCVFNKMATYAMACSMDSTVWVINVQMGKMIRKLPMPPQLVFSVSISPDGKQALTCPADGTVMLWDIESGKLMQSYPGKSGPVMLANFSPDGKWILTRQTDGHIKLWEKKSGRFVRIVNTSLYPIDFSKKEDIEYYLRTIVCDFSNDSKYIISASLNNVASIQDVLSGKTMAKLEGISILNFRPSFSHDGKLLATCGAKDGRALTGDMLSRSEGNWMGRVWDLRNGKLLYNLEGHKGIVDEIQFSPDDQYIVTGSEDSIAKLWNATSGKLIYNFSHHDGAVQKCYFTSDSRFLISQSLNSTGRIWDLETGKMVSEIKHDPGQTNGSGIYYISLSNTGRYFKTVFYDYKVFITETSSGKIMMRFDARADSITRILIDPNDKYIYYSRKNDIYIKDISNGNLVSTLKGHKKNISTITINEQGTRLASVSEDSSIKIWDLPSGKILVDLVGLKSIVPYVEFSPDNKYFLTNSYDSTIRILETVTGKLLHSFKDESTSFYTSKFTSNSQYVVSQSYDKNLKIWDIQHDKAISKIPLKYLDSYLLKPEADQVLVDNKFSVDFFNFGQSSSLLKIIPVSYNDYLVIDSAGRYDGTEAALKLLYLVCNNEVIELDQIKEQLWVPDLAERVMKGDSINARTLNDLNICGLSPEVENKSDVTGYHYTITPGRGGLGETVVFVNGIEAGRFKPSQLNKNGGSYDLNIKKDEFRNYFIAGQENQVTVKAYTSDNSISSRGVRIGEDISKQAATPANLFAVMIGVSDYKGEEMDLKYAAKDATDISNAISIAAKKLLNTDGGEHVFMYNLTTSTEHYQLPEKNGIKKLLEEIGRKASANDILLIFFAGHGVMEGEKKQFYFLTADASKSSTASAIADVGISTAELAEWMKPQNIKAQKRILIFDACNSGQAIRDFVKMGNESQDYLAARNDDKARQIKAMDKLNEKSGLFILSASASNQSAYEMGRYSQGLLTYSLLKAIKQQPDILEDGRYLNVSRWFNAAEKTVSDLSRESGARQEPQIVTNTNFNIGVVDQEVIAKIVLPQEKPLFAASNFQNNDEAIADDDLELSKQINLQLNDLAARGTDSRIVYVTATNSPDAFSLSGRYVVKGNVITAMVNIKQNKVIKARFEIGGTKDKLNDLALSIAEKAVELTK